MDENTEDMKCMYYKCSALQATINPLYDILGVKYALKAYVVAI